MGSIPAGGPIVDEFSSTVPGWFFDMCMIQLEPKTHLPFRIYPVSSQMPKILIDLPLKLNNFYLGIVVGFIKCGIFQYSGNLSPI